MRHVLWIGGPPRSGKTTVARRLARRYGLRLYSADTRTWVHRDRALAGGSESAQLWESLTPAARWDQEPRALLEMSLHVERGPMVIDDLGGLPLAPLIVAEGSTLPASALTSGMAESSRSVWLMPTAECLEGRIVASDTASGPANLYRLLRETIEQETRLHRVPTLTISNSTDLVELFGAVEHRFLGALTDGPRAETPAERGLLLREMNAAIAGQVRGYYARPWAEGDAAEVGGFFVCECGDPTCDAEVWLTVGEAEAAEAVTAAGHEISPPPAKQGLQGGAGPGHG